MHLRHTVHPLLARNRGVVRGEAEVLAGTQRSTKASKRDVKKDTGGKDRLIRSNFIAPV